MTPRHVSAAAVAEAAAEAADLTASFSWAPLGAHAVAYSTSSCSRVGGAMIRGLSVLSATPQRFATSAFTLMASVTACISFSRNRAASSSRLIFLGALASAVVAAPRPVALPWLRSLLLLLSFQRALPFCPQELFDRDAVGGDHRQATSSSP